MPTGYTAGVQDGSIKTFEQFALRCARAMGALAALRDLPLSEPVPEILPGADVSYLEGRLKEVTADLTELNWMSEQVIQDTYEEELQAAIEADRKREEERLLQKARYEDMLEQVRAWNPPEGHQDFQAFMITQLQESIAFDTGSLYRSVDNIKCESAASWHMRQRERLGSEITRLQDQLEQRTKMYQDRQKWWDELRASL